MSLHIVCTPMPGDSIEATAAEAIALAKRLNVPIRFDFNDQPMLATDTDTVEGVVATYNQFRPIRWAPWARWPQVQRAPEGGYKW